MLCPSMFLLLRFCFGLAFDFWARYFRFNVRAFLRASAKKSFIFMRILVAKCILKEKVILISVCIIEYFACFRFWRFCLILRI